MPRQVRRRRHKVFVSPGRRRHAAEYFMAVRAVLALAAFQPLAALFAAALSRALTLPVRHAASYSVQHVQRTRRTAGVNEPPVKRA